MVKAAKIVTLISISTFVLVGCSGSVKPAPGAPTMAQAYQQAWSSNPDAFNAESGDANQAGLDNQSYMDKVRSQVPPVVAPESQKITQVTDSLSQQFPTLPNPSLVMYVYGHYAGDDEAPVPGYYTKFSGYTRDYYALPSEVQIIN